MSTGPPRDQEELAWRETRDSGGAGGQSDDEDLDWIRYLTGGGSGSSSDFSSDEAPRRSVRARFARKSSGESESGGPSEDDAGGAGRRTPRDGGARGDGRPVPSRRPRPRNGRTAGGVISVVVSGTGVSGTRRMPGRPSRFPAGGTTAAGRIRAAAGRSAVAGVPTRVTLFRVRMTRVRSAGGLKVTRAPGRPASEDGWGQRRAASLGAASAWTAGCGRPRWFASGRRVRAQRAARVQAGPE